VVCGSKGLEVMTKVIWHWQQLFAAMSGTKYGKWMIAFVALR
jgi:hypothetical protein